MYNKEYYSKNRKRIIKNQLKYYNKHKKQQKLYYQENRERIRKYQTKYKKMNRNKIRKYQDYRLKNNINIKLAEYLRHRIYDILKIRKTPKSSTTMKLVGCSIEQLKYHLESRFKPGMTWKNYGKWHIDHIRPCASFNLNKPSEQKKCFHYTNLQPLWAKENLKKSNKFYKGEN
jgi:hypothetical protein